MRFIERELFRWEDAQQDLVSVKALYDPQTEERIEKTSRNFNIQFDNRGGVNGFYNPAYSCSKDTIIFLHVHIEIRVKNQWKGYISFQHNMGSPKRTYARKKITIRNKEPQDSVERLNKDVDK